MPRRPIAQLCSLVVSTFRQGPIAIYDTTSSSVQITRLRRSYHSKQIAKAFLIMDAYKLKMILCCRSSKDEAWDGRKSVMIQKVQIRSVLKANTSKKRFSKAHLKSLSLLQVIDFFLPTNRISPCLIGGKFGNHCWLGIYKHTAESSPQYKFPINHFPALCL